MEMVTAKTMIRISIRNSEILCQNGISLLKPGFVNFLGVFYNFVFCHISIFYLIFIKVQVTIFLIFRNGWKVESYFENEYSLISGHV